MRNTEKIMQSVAKRITQRILGGRDNNEEFISGMAAGLQSAGYPELSDAMTDWESAPPEELSKLINRWAGERVFKSDLTLENPAHNPRGVYTTYSAWRAAAKKAGAVRFEGDKDIAQAFDGNGRGVAEWDGAEGYIYRKSEMRNPMRREEPLYVKYLSLKSGEEPFMMQGTKYEYVWAEYPGGIKDIGVYSYANDLVYSYDSFRKMMNLDRTNPVHSRNPQHRIAVRLSKSRQRNPLESGANISDDKDINFRASNMG